MTHHNTFAFGLQRRGSLLSTGGRHSGSHPSWSDLMSVFIGGQWRAWREGVMGGDDQGCNGWMIGRNHKEENGENRREETLGLD